MRMGFDIRLAALGLATLTLAACGDPRPAFDGVTFRASLDAAKDTPELFVVEVRDAGKSLDGARAAGRYEAVRYCIETFGNSRIDWAQGPDAEASALQFDDGDLILKGQCAGW